MYLSNVDQREIEPTPKTKSDKIDDGSVKSTVLLSTLKETPQIPIQVKTPLLQNFKQIHKPSAQQKILTFEKVKTLLTCELGKKSHITTKKI